MLLVTLWSDWECPVLLGACVMFLLGGDTFTSGGRGLRGEWGSSSVRLLTTDSGLDSDLGMLRALTRVTESGRGKVPMPLSRVLI